MADQSIWGARAGPTRVRMVSTKAPIRHLDLTLMLAVLLLTGIGNLAIKFASAPLLEARGADPNYYLKRQLIYFSLASIGFVISLLVDYRQIKGVVPVIYGGGLLFLVLVLLPMGERVAGAQRWVNLGVLQVQPSELMKLILIAALAALFSRKRGDHGPLQIFQALLMVALPALLVYLQPDLGTAMVLVAVTFGIMLVAGVKVRWLMSVLAVGVLAIILAIQVGVLRDYQIARLTAFLDSESDPQRTGYNLAQSKTAIGSGGFAGKGLADGSQTNLAFVPEQHTDFVFTAIGEKKGFVGAAVLMGLFALLLWRCLRIALLSKELFGTLLAGGVAAMFAFQVFVNIGMTVGIMPITGIPLPFVSAGGSSLITSYVAVGLLTNVHMRRFT